MMVFSGLKQALMKAPSSFSATLLLVALAYLSYATPMIYAYFESTNFIYVNAWDEETYLSYQGALAALKVPGYWTSGAVVYLLQNLGLSGGDINVVFDCLITPLTFLLLTWSLRASHVEKKRALIYSIIILFTPILFNFGNPLIEELFTRSYGLLGYGWEPYQSILRTPEPQLSFFLVALAIVGYLKTKKTVLLFAPLPFLYFYVAISYGYFLVGYCLLTQVSFFSRSSLTLRIVLASLLSYLTISLGFSIFDLLFLSKDAFIIAAPNIYIKSHVPVIPISGIVTLGLLAIQRQLSRHHDIKERSHIEAQLFVTLSLFLICNIHVLSGTMLSYKNYMDYSTSLIGGAGIAVFLDFLKKNKIKYARLVCGLMVLYILSLTFRAYGFNFNTMEYSYFRGLQFTSSEDYKRAYQDPMSIVIPDRDLSAKLPYSVSKMPIPLFSYQYNFPLIANGCRPVLDRMESVTATLKSLPDSLPLSNIDYFESAIKAFSGQNYVPLEKQHEFPLSKFCSDLPMQGKIHVLENRFKDNGWIKIKLF